jgi:hypothetical protein
MMNRNGLLLPALLALAACGSPPAPPAASAAAPTDTDIAPPIVAPDEIADPAEPPSYEVGIASAAADRNRALGRCAEQPEAVRTQCEQEANAAFADVEKNLENLRGNAN